MEALQEVKMSPYAVYQKPDPEVIFTKDPSVVVQQQVEDRRTRPKDLHLRAQDFADHGFTASGCPRCRWALDHGWQAETTLSHSRECRDRMRTLIRDSSDAGRLRVEAALTGSRVPLDVLALGARVVVVVVGLEVGHVDAKPPYGRKLDVLRGRASERRALSEARSRSWRPFTHGAWPIGDSAHCLGLPSLAF